MTSIWVKFRFKKEIPTSIWVKFHFNIGLVCLVVLSCLACHLGRLTVRVSFLSSSRARGRQDRTTRFGRAPGSEVARQARQNDEMLPGPNRWTSAGERVGKTERQDEFSTNIPSEISLAV